MQNTPKPRIRPSRHPDVSREAGNLFWVATNIHRLRKSAGLTQAQLAEKAGITGRALRGIENAVTDANPTLRTLEGVAGALGLEVVELFKRRKGMVEV